MLMWRLPAPSRGAHTRGGGFGSLPLRSAHSAFASSSDALDCRVAGELFLIVLSVLVGGSCRERLVQQFAGGRLEVARERGFSNNWGRGVGILREAREIGDDRDNSALHGEELYATLAGRGVGHEYCSVGGELTGNFLERKSIADVAHGSPGGSPVAAAEKV